MHTETFTVKNSTISHYGTCKTCGWPIIHACCNDNFLNFLGNMDDIYADWWVYCTNKGCIHHDGESIFQDEIDWCL